jgi:glycerate kinase
MILICPTAFKGTLSARDAAQAMAAGAARAARSVEVRLVPLSDGGNGLLDALEAAAGGRGHGTRVAGPLGTSVTARYLRQDGRVVIETAEACGLHLVPIPLRDPMRASTRGVGELILAAVEADPETPLIVGLGGSATVDAGAGMARALGWSLLDEDGTPIPSGGAGLLELATIRHPDDPPRLPGMVVLADVTNPLLGPEGAAPVFGPQKGASPEDVSALEAGLERWAGVVARDVGHLVADLPGAGAAGGLGAAFAALLDAPPRSGAGWLLEAVAFDDRLNEADVVVTGEGTWDAQSSMGKVTGEVVTRATARGIPALVVAGSATGDPPPGARIVTGGGSILESDDLARLVAETLPALLAQRRRR